MREDYPAAHSMDTDWFAVDADGHVALLRSGEEGAVPIVWGGEQAGGQAFHELWRGRGTVDVHGLPQQPGSLQEHLGDGWEPAPPDRRYPYGHALLRLAHPRAVELVAGAHRVRTQQGLYAWVREVLLADLWELLARGWVQQGWLFSDFPLDRFGIYLYEARHQSLIVGPYERGERPRIPLLASTLPPETRQRAVSLPQVSFARDPLVQPLESLPCRAYGTGWIDSRNRLHDMKR
jgi:hypothetical protein